MIKRQTLYGKITQGIPEKCLSHLRIPDPEDCPKMADGQPLGFCVVRVRNCPRCNNYKTCKLKCRLTEKDLAKHEEWLAKYDKETSTTFEKPHNCVYSIVNDLINKSCDHVSDMLIVPGTFRANPEIGYDEYKINMLCRTIVHALHSSFDIDEDLAWIITSKAIINEFKFKHCLEPKSNQAFVQYLTNFVCRNLPFDKSMELEKKPNTSNTTPGKDVENLTQKGTKQMNDSDCSQQTGYNCTDIEVRLTLRVPGHIDTSTLRQKLQEAIGEAANREAKCNGHDEYEVAIKCEAFHHCYICKVRLN